MLGGGYYTITGEWSWDVVLAALPYALGTTAVILGKHIDKLEADEGRHPHPTRPPGRKGLPLRCPRHDDPLVPPRSISRLDRLLHPGDARHLPLAISFLQLIVPVYGSPKPVHMPEDYRDDLWPLWFVAFAFLHNRRFGALFVLGLVAEVVLQSSGLT